MEKTRFETVLGSERGTGGEKVKINLKLKTWDLNIENRHKRKMSRRRWVSALL